MNVDFAEKMKLRTKNFALEIIKLCKSLPNHHLYWNFSNQLLRSATSVTANYRAVCRARSDKEFYAKLCIVVEEMDESLLWMELLRDSELADVDESLFKEANELLAILAKSRKTVKARLKS